MSDNFDNYILWYRQPAKEWVEALPVGNGRISAMVFGKVDKERLQLNEETVWDGYVMDCNNPEAFSALQEVRKLLFEGKNNEATEIASKKMMGIPDRIKSYQILGDLNLEFQINGEVENYYRELNIDTGIVKTEYSINGVKFTREVFATAVDQVIVARIESDKPKSISLKGTMTRPQEATTKRVSDNCLMLHGQCGTKGVKFCAYVLANVDNGSVNVTDDEMVIKDADSVTLLISAATSYVNQNDTSADPYKQCQDYLPKKSYKELKSAHIADHRRIFRRVEINLGVTDAVNMPTDERLEAFKNGVDDPHLISLYFQYGRYLLMGSSRPGCLPANLQGIWNEHINAPWNSD
ncbi:MAG: glycoside hydrolase family 95 protein, partial [Candidatus Poribacteria bacterium]